MQHADPTPSQLELEDEYLFGWDSTPDIVSAWANRSGEAIIWRREGERVSCSRERFRPWVFATMLDDLASAHPYSSTSGRVYFRGLSYENLRRLQFDLETTSLDPRLGRIFMVAVRDSHGLATVLEARQPEDEARLIADLCALIRERDPDVIENHNLFGFDLPFLEQRAAIVQAQ